MFSCSNSGNKNSSDNNNTQNNGNGANGATEETTQANASDIVAGLPAADYGGYQFNIWTSNWFNATLEGRQAPDEEQTGEPINDALYTRDQLVEAKYNINIQYTLIEDYSQFTTKASNSVKAGDDAFDFAMGDMMNVTKGLAQTGAIYDFNTIPHVDLTQPCWSKYAIRDLTIDGKFYFPTGDITARYPGSQYVLLFNKNLFTNMGLDYPYQSVLDGKWTLDAFESLIKDKTKDLNGDGTLDKSDFYGFYGYQSSYLLYAGAGGSIIKIQDGNPAFNVNNDTANTIMDKLASFMGNSAYMYYTTNYQSYEEVTMFKNDQLLFLPQTGTNISMFRDMNSDFGIIPMPKYDENQADYYSYCQPWGSAAVCVPQTNSNIDRTGMIIEALAMAGRYTSTPAAYDVTLKSKYSRDTDSESMLDIIFAGSCYDFGDIYNWGGIFDSFVATLDKGQSFTSKFEALQGTAQAAMDKTVAIFTGAQS